MKYMIARATFGQYPELELTREEFDALHEAKRGVLFALGIEERFSILRENYREYEREIFEIAQKQVLYAHFEWSEFAEDLHAINRRLLNVVAAARLYRDQLTREVKATLGASSPIRHQVRKHREEEEAGCLPFEFMETVRDTIQHVFLPVWQSARGSSVDERPNGERMIRHTAEPRLSLAQLLERKEISRDLYARMKPRADRTGLIALNPLLREYMQSLGRLHKANRETLAEQVAAWDAEYLGAIERGREVVGSTFALALCCEYEDSDDELNTERPPKDEDLFDDLVKRRKFLEARAHRAEMMPSAKDYVSTE